MSLILLERGSDVLVAEANVWRRIRMHAMADRLERDLAAGVSPDTSVEHSLRAQFLATPKQRTITAQALWRSLDDAFDSARASLTRGAGMCSLTRQAVRSNSRELRQIAATSGDRLLV